MDHSLEDRLHKLKKFDPDRKFYYDTSTRNSSFVSTYLELYKLGIIDNKFFLKIYDESLIGIPDPRDPNLPIEIKFKILQEMINNPWYFYREIVRIPVPGNRDGIRFSLHRGNLAVLFCLLKCLSLMVVLPRQNYKTISSVCHFHWQYDWGTEGSTFLFSNKEYDDSKLNVERLKNIRDLTPDHFLIKDAKNDRNRIEKIFHHNNSNTIKAVSTAKDLDTADKLGKNLPHKTVKSYCKLL